MQLRNRLYKWKVCSFNDSLEIFDQEHEENSMALKMRQVYWEVATRQHDALLPHTCIDETEHTGKMSSTALTEQ